MSLGRRKTLKALTPTQLGRYIEARLPAPREFVLLYVTDDGEGHVLSNYGAPQTLKVVADAYVGLMLQTRVTDMQWEGGWGANA